MEAALEIMENIERGTIVRPSQHYKSQFTRKTQVQFGTVKRKSRTAVDCWVIQWAEKKTPETLHRKFFTVFAADEITSRRFGRNYEKPCADLTMICCAVYECQKLNMCRKMNEPSKDDATA